MDEYYIDRKKFLAELNSARELAEKTKTNLLLMISFTLLGMGMIVGSLLEEGLPNALGIIYSITTAAFCIYNGYLAIRILKVHPFPEKPNFNNLVDFQINHIRDGHQKIQHYFFLGITPVYVGLLGMLSMEFKIGDVLNISKVVWIKFSLVQVLYALCLGRALYLKFYFKKIAKRFSINI